MFKSFTPQEKKIVLSITFAVMVRMLGLFLLLPVLSPYVKTLEGATPELIGLAVGIYGLAQALLQIPFGYLSDKYGRKPIIFVGMITYAMGSFMAALAGNIWAMVFARFLQGFGAISSALIALVADLIREEVRTRAFASIGASIALTFALSMLISPILAGKFGVPFIFFLTALFGLLALFILMVQVPEPKTRSKEREINPSINNILFLLKEKNQLFLNFSVGLLHAYLVLIFTLIPYELVYRYNMPKLEHWKIYLPSVLLALLLMVPSIITAERKKKFMEVFLAAILMILLSFGVAQFFNGVLGVFFTVLLFFLGFNLLEALIPSLLTRLTHEDIRGIAFGFFNTVQFLGAFIGGVWGGYAIKHGYEYMTLLSIFLAILWLILSYLWFKNLRMYTSQ